MEEFGQRVMRVVSCTMFITVVMHIKKILKTLFKTLRDEGTLMCRPCSAAWFTVIVPIQHSAVLFSMFVWRLLLLLLMLTERVLSTEHEAPVAALRVLKGDSRSSFYSCVHPSEMEVIKLTAENWECS